MGASQPLDSLNRLSRGRCHATFHFVCVGWVLFVTDLTTASRIIPRLLLLR